LNACSKKKAVSFAQENERLRQETDRLKKEYEQQNERLRQEIVTLKKEYEQKIDKLQNQIFEIAMQPNTIMTSNSNTTRMTQIINQLGTYAFDQQWMEQVLEENFTEDVFRGGPDKIAELAAQVLLMDTETQKPKVVCTDISRKMYRFIDPETHALQVDPGFQKTHRLIKWPLGQANLRVFTDTFMHNDPDDLHRDQWKVNDEFIEDHHKFPEKLHAFLKKSPK
jgi:predicted RNase H-like nuclease (RuvC/YqgF family)